MPTEPIKKLAEKMSRRKFLGRAMSGSLGLLAALFGPAKSALAHHRHVACCHLQHASNCPSVSYVYSGSCTNHWYWLCCDGQHAYFCHECGGGDQGCSLAEYKGFQTYCST